VYQSGVVQVIQVEEIRPPLLRMPVENLRIAICVFRVTGIGIPENPPAVPADFRIGTFGQGGKEFTAVLPDNTKFATGLSPPSYLISGDQATDRWAIGMNRICIFHERSGVLREEWRPPGCPNPGGGGEFYIFCWV
jgi:hypothetical protein